MTAFTTTASAIQDPNQKPLPPGKEPLPPIGEPEPDRLPDETPNPNPDETDAPPLQML